MKKKQWLVTVTVIPKSKENKVSYVSYDGNLIRVRVTEFPENNKANRAVIRVLSEHFGIKQNDIILVAGQSSKHKKFLLPEHLKLLKEDVQEERLHKQRDFFDKDHF